MSLMVSTLFLMVVILLRILFGWMCGEIAQKQGRDVIIARIMGFCFGIITLIVYLIKGDKSKGSTQSKKMSIEKKISIILAILGGISLIWGLWLLRNMLAGIRLIIIGILCITMTLFLIKTQK